jgi:hypothetical protein
MSKHANTTAFQVRCDAGQSGALSASTDRISVTVGQSVRRDGIEQMWDFVLVLAKRESDGALTTRILLCHPEWAEPLEIASVQSSPAGINLHIADSEPAAGNHL